MGCSGSDPLQGILAYLFDPDLPVRGGGPPAPGWVRDEDFDTAEEAFQAALRQDVPADPRGWLTERKFVEKVINGRFGASFSPEAERVVGVLGRVLVGVASAAAFVAVFVASAWLDPSLFREQGDELVYSIVLVAIPALIAAGLAGGNLADGLARRSLARELAREGPSDDVPPHRQPEPDPMPGGHAARHVQDDKSAGYSQDPQAAADPRDVQDAVPDPDA